MFGSMGDLLVSSFLFSKKVQTKSQIFIHKVTCEYVIPHHVSTLPYTYLEMLLYFFQNLEAVKYHLLNRDVFFLSTFLIIFQ